MQIISDPAEMQRRVTTLRQQGRRIGLVPTMGYFHEGHLSLFRPGRRENDILAISIFVNPMQFDRKEDLESYPIDITGDLAKAEAEGADLVFLPEQEAVYPQGYATFVEVEGLTSRWEGTYRPGHFRGVTTVVAKLFHVVKPHRAYFGQKDYQQTCIIQRMVTDLSMDIEVVVLPTVREPDGLALSSRNVNLTVEERRQAPTVYQALCSVADRVKAGEQDAVVLVERMRRMIEERTSATIDYVALCHPETLEPLQKIGGPAIALVAIRFSRARLIDNILLS
ncbi:MAG: pantoate--beta-alanine ligase [Candidatus Methylomirabilales bacterium]